MVRTLPEEIPVAMVYDGATCAVLMATPADVADFAIGFSMTEGIIAELSEIEAFEEIVQPQGIEARMWLRADRRTRLAARRRFMAGPVGCGLCGIDSLEQALRPLPAVAGAKLRLTRADVLGATEALRALQPLHDQTRATHAAGFLCPRRRHRPRARMSAGTTRWRFRSALTAVSTPRGAWVMTSRLSTNWCRNPPWPAALLS